MYASVFGNVSAIIQRLYSGTARQAIFMIHFRIDLLKSYYSIRFITTAYDHAIDQ